METTDLIEVLSRGEDSRHQFKENFTNADALAAEIVAFSNSAGGQIFVGVQTMVRCLVCLTRTSTV